MMSLHLRAILVWTLVAAASPAVAAAHARDRFEGPRKDCTRVNGRFGYYANPWCSPAEQLAWDRYEARRLLRSR